MKIVTKSRFCHFLSVLLLLAGTACSDQAVTWSAAERQNARNLFESIQAANEAATLSNALPAGSAGTDAAEAVLAQLRRASNFAALVDETVLIKAHPALRKKFRQQYQPALAQLIRYYETGELPAGQTPARDMRDFSKWFIDKQYEFRW